MRRFGFGASAGLIATLLLAGDAAARDVRDVLLEGVREIGAPGAPGSVAVYAPTAEAIVVGDSGAKAKASVVAAAKLGKGRVVAFAHNGYFSADQLAKADTGRLVANAVRWAGGMKKAPNVGVLGPDSMVGFLNAQGIPARKATLKGSLDGFDALVMTPGGESDAEAIRVRSFVQAGGGLLVGATGWGWKQGSGAAMSTFIGNRMLAGSGLAWTDGFAGRTAKDGYAAVAKLSPFLNAAHALNALGKGAQPNAEDSAAGLESVLLALRSMPSADAKFRSRVVKTLGGLNGVDMVPTQKNPADTKDMRRRFAIGLETAVAQAAAVDQVRPLAAAADFPGAVDSGAKRVTRTGTIDLSVPRWHALGLYAPPGAKITVTGPAAVGALKLAVRIGCHTDGLWHHDSWQRLPEITRRFPVEGSKTIAASAMGGMLYIDVPDNAPHEKVELTIAGAVEAPLFRLGRTTNADWKTIRNRPAPWAEVGGNNVIFTVPSALARRLDDPEALMKFWDEVVAAQDAMAAGPPRRSPERIVVDRQISAGYMHSGYPIMCPMDGSMEDSMNLAKLRKEGSWGHFHELGHNHQNGDWTFDGTGEVTNNVLAFLIYDRVLGLPYDSGHGAIRGKEMRAKRIRDHLAAGAPFDKWKSDPFLALMMYIQLYEGFGWDPFERVFAEYPKLAKDERPKNDDEKRDQWMVRFSKAVGKNLGPFFQTWGVPTGQAARDSIKNLPAWMPPGMNAGS